MEIKNLTSVSTVVINSLLMLLKDNHVDIESVVMQLSGNHGEALSPEVNLMELAQQTLGELKKASVVPEWISVDDRLPKEGEEVLVHHYGHIVQAIKNKNFHGGFKQRNCYGWESVSSHISHWMPKSIKLPESFHFYYDHDAKVAKEKAMIEAQGPSND